jgi:hypothetical protein
MKRILVKGLVLLVLIVAAAWVGYFIGRYDSSKLEQQEASIASIEEAMKSPDFKLGVVLEQKGTFVVSFGALQKLRAGDIGGGTREVETLCFSAAATVYGSHPETRFVAKSFLDDFKHYRQTYRANNADWSIMERNLERELADWK